MKAHFTFFLVLFCCTWLTTSAQKPPKEYAIGKCEKRTKNETVLAKCKECIENYKLSENPDKSEVKSMLRACVPRKEPKEWLKGKCEDNTEKQEEIVACFDCVDNYKLPQNVTRDDASVKEMRKACLPKPSLKFKAKRQCAKKFRTKNEVEACQQCIQNYDLPERASCEEVKEMKRQCITERAGREMWADPLVEDDESADED